jgi:hypothetical protein
MKKSLATLVMGITVISLVGCTNNAKEVTMATKDYDLEGFTKIEVGGAFEMEITRGDSFKVSVTADDFPHVRVEKVDNTLIIKRQGIEWFAPFHSRPTATVTLPLLTYLDISGASQVNIENFQSDADLVLNLSGASHIKAINIAAGGLDLKVTGASTLTGHIKATKDAKLEASGASRIELTGAAANMVVKITGASKAELGQFPAQNADLEVSGASNASVNLNGKLNANVSGASKLLWAGSPIMGDIQTSGASSLKRK